MIKTLRFPLLLCVLSLALPALSIQAGVLDNLKKKAAEKAQEAAPSTPAPAAAEDAPASSGAAPASDEKPTGKLAVAVPVIIGTYKAAQIDTITDGTVTSLSGIVQVLRAGDKRVRVIVKDHPELSPIETDLEVGEAPSNDSIFGGPADEYVTLRLEVNGPATLFAANKKSGTTWEVINGAKALQPKPAKLDVTLEKNLGIKRVYWSGASAVDQARAYAAANQATIILNTAGGDLARQLSQNAGKEEFIKIWSQCSADFSRSTTGEVHVFVGTETSEDGAPFSDLNDPRIWRDVEFPILKEQGNPVVFHIERAGKWEIASP